MKISHHYARFVRGFNNINNNAQANLTSPDDSWYVRAYVKNIADEDSFVGTYLSSASSDLFINVFTMEPRTYGLAIAYNFQ